jgi:hypothetical protein
MMGQPTLWRLENDINDTDDPVDGQQELDTMGSEWARSCLDSDTIRQILRSTTVPFLG